MACISTVQSGGSDRRSTTKDTIISAENRICQHVLSLEQGGFTSACSACNYHDVAHIIYIPCFSTIVASLKLIRMQEKSEALATVPLAFGAWDGEKTLLKRRKSSMHDSTGAVSHRCDSQRNFFSTNGYSLSPRLCMCWRYRARRVVFLVLVTLLRRVAEHCRFRNMFIQAIKIHFLLIMPSFDVEVLKVPNIK